MEELKILQKQRIPIRQIEPNNGQIEGIPKNPRFIRDNKYRKLLQSIKDNPEMLTLRELIVVPQGDSFVVIGGNMRLRAMKELGHTEAICTVVPEGFTKEQIKAFILKDNSSFGEWDIDDLLNEWEEELIEAAAIDIPDIDDPKDSEDEEAEDDNFDVSANTPKKATSRDGDIYRLGEHRLICGDSTKDMYIEALMDGEQADLLVTDPPYNVNYEAKNHEKITNDNMADAAFVAFLTDTFRNANNAMKPGASFYIWHADYQGFNFRTAAQQTGWQTRQCLIWNKNSFTLGRQDYQWKHEPCLFGWKDGAAHYFTNRRNLATVIENEQDLEKLSKAEMKAILEKIFIQQEIPATVIDCDKPARNPDHPTMKPVPLIGKLINNSSRRKDIVLDIFGGSGTTLIAAEQLHRKCRMVEFEPIYVDVIIKRWEELTGMKAVLLGNIHDGKEETKEG